MSRRRETALVIADPQERGVKVHRTRGVEQNDEQALPVCSPQSRRTRPGASQPEMS